MSTYNIKDGNGSVINTIVANEEFMLSQYPNGNYEVVVEPYIEPPAPVEPANAWWIYVGPLFDRFGANQIPILASSDPYVQAVIKTASVRKYIDLKRADLPAMLDIIVNAGFAIDTNAILTTPVPEEDRYVG